MDIDKLIEQLRNAAKLETYYNSGYNGLYNLAATALSTLQDENARLRAYLEYEREHADAYYEECGQWEAENEKLRAESIMHHNAADNYFAELTEYRQERNEALAELEQVKRERDAAVKCIEEIEDAFNFQRMSAIGLRISEWRGPQKED